MATYSCTECDGDVEVDTTNLGPWGGLGLLPPVRVLCPECIRAEDLVVHDDGGKPWLLLRGQQFRMVGGAFARSEHPRVIGTYEHDERRQQ